MTSTQRTPTELEAAGDLILLTAGELAGRLPLTPNAHPVTPEEHNEIMSTLTFSKKFTDHMAHIRWTREGGWDDRSVTPYGPLELTPGASVFHYCRSVFKDIRAYKREDGSVWTFRLGYNAARLNHSARHLALPEMSREDFAASLVDYVRTDVKWIPEVDGSSLYLRPFMSASEEFVGVHPVGVADCYVVGSPSGPCFKGDLSGIAIWMEREYHRAGPGGTGNAKAGGSCTASLLPRIQAEVRGFSQVCFLDTYENKYLEELDDMNMFVVMADRTTRTPELIDVILEGGARSAILRMLHDEDMVIREEKIALSEVVDGIRSGTVTKVSTCGMAAVVTPITRLADNDFGVEAEVRDKAREVHKRVTDTRWDHAEGPYGWTCHLV